MTPERRAEIERDYPLSVCAYSTERFEHARRAVRDLLTALREAEAELRQCRVEFGANLLAVSPSVSEMVRAEIGNLEKLKSAYGMRQNEHQKHDDAICQTLGKALGYPRYCDDQKNFPGATEADGVCVGDHVAESLAEEAARRIKELTEGGGRMTDTPLPEEIEAAIAELVRTAYLLPNGVGLDPLDGYMDNVRRAIASALRQASWHYWRKRVADAIRAMKETP